MKELKVHLKLMLLGSCGVFALAAVLCTIVYLGMTFPILAKGIIFTFIFCLLSYVFGLCIHEEFLGRKRK